MHCCVPSPVLQNLTQGAMKNKIYVLDICRNLTNSVKTRDLKPLYIGSFMGGNLVAVGAEFVLVVLNAVLGNVVIEIDVFEVD